VGETNPGLHTARRTSEKPDKAKYHLVITAYPDHRSFFTSSGKKSMVERQEFYRKMNVSVRVHEDDLELEIATPAISQSEDPS
jgi:hypothetical protein